METKNPTNCQPEGKLVQKKLDQLNIKRICHESSEYFIIGNTNSTSRFLAPQEKQFGYWLQSYASSNLGTLIDNKWFKTAIALSLGYRICLPHTCLCGEETDLFAHHSFKCRKSAGNFPKPL